MLKHLLVSALIIFSYSLFGQSTGQVIATTPNISGNTVKISGPRVANEIVIINREQDSNYNPLQSTTPYGVFYQGNSWFIVDYSGNDIPAGAVFNYISIPSAGQNAFIHETTSSNVNGIKTTIDYPFIDGNSNVVLLVTQHYGQFNNSTIKTVFENNKWHIVNMDASVPMPTGTKFNVLICNSDNNTIGSMYYNSSQTDSHTALTWDFISNIQTGNGNPVYHFAMYHENAFVNALKLSIVATSMKKTKDAPIRVGGAVKGTPANSSTKSGSVRAKPANSSRNRGTTVTINTSPNNNTNSSTGQTVRVDTNGTRPRGGNANAGNSTGTKTVRLNPAILQAALDNTINNGMRIFLDNRKSYIAIGSQIKEFTIPSTKITRPGIMGDWEYKVENIRSTTFKSLTQKEAILTGVSGYNDFKNDPNRVYMQVEFESDDVELKGRCPACITAKDGAAPDINWRRPSIVIIFKPVAKDQKITLEVEQIKMGGEFYTVSAYDFILPHILHFMEEKMETSIQNQLQQIFRSTEIQTMITNSVSRTLTTGGITNVDSIDLSTEGTIKVTGK